MRRDAAPRVAEASAAMEYRDIQVHHIAIDLQSIELPVIVVLAQENRS